MYNDHSIGTAPICPGRVFTNWRVFERHMESHHKEKYYQCPTCKKWYKGEEKLDKHMDVAHGANQLICDKCGKQFSPKDSLKTHQVKHKSK